MLFGKRTSLRTVRSRRADNLVLRAERLEERTLMAIDLGSITGTSVATGFGVEHAGLQTGGGAGWAVSEVGDMLGNGFDDYVITAPTIAFTGTAFGLGNGNGARAFLIFGSKAVNSNTIQDFLALTPDQRVSDLANLGNANQTNPIDGNPSFNFDGLTFFANQNSNSQLGASVTSLGDINSDGLADFMIGAPGANDSTGANDGAGRAYIVYGTPALANQTNKLVDLDNLTTNTGLNVLTFVSNIPGGHLGRGVGSGGNILGTGSNDVVVGAPDASINGLNGSGVVYVISDANGGILRPPTTQTVQITTVGQTNGVAGVQIAGANAGDQAGFSVDGVGNTDGGPASDLLIGAPARGVAPGSAYLLYGSNTFAAAATLNTATNVRYIDLSRVLTPVTGTPDVPGAVFAGDVAGDNTGFAVASAGDFNADGLSDFMIGSPGVNSATGRVNLIFGQSASSSSGHLAGLFDLGNLPATVNNVSFEGAAFGALAGYSMSSVGDINGDKINEILIGSPGFSLDAGAAYLIPGNPTLFGDFNLANAGQATLSGQIITASQPSGFNLVGISVSGRIGLTSQGHQADGSNKPTFLVGAAGAALTAGRTTAGIGYLVESARITLAIPPTNAITTTIGIDTAKPPFNVNASTPNTVQIFVYSNAAANFAPVTDINPATVVVNGIAFPSATIAADPVDENNDGIPDAIITIQPRSALGLTNATTTITVTGKTLATSPIPNRFWTGTATVTVTGGGGGGGGGGVAGTTSAFFAGFEAQGFAPPYGERLVPTLPVVAKNSVYKPIPQFVAYQEFRPSPAFNARNYAFFHPRAAVTRKTIAHRTTTLGHTVFNRGRFPTGLFNGVIHHKGKLV
jgi:hypothetical protein